MTTHRFSILLVASFGVLMFANAQAGGLSMDSGSRMASESSSSASDADCPKPAITRTIQTGVQTIQRSNPASTQISDARQPSANPAVAPGNDVADSAPPVGSSTGGTGGLITPSKLRGNRWQSLVPGAIK